MIVWRVLIRLICAMATLGLCPCCAVRPSTSLIEPNAPQLRYTGWFDTRSPRSVRFAWSGTSIAATFTGTSLSAHLSDTPVEDDTRDTDWLTVVIDDSAPKKLALAEGRHIYPLASGLSSGSHRVLLWKRTEAEVGVVTFRGFSIDAGARLTPPPAAPLRRLVFIGDSITAGYGNEGPDGTCHWSARRENSHATYGAYAARELHADYVAAAWSGKGLTRNYDPRDRIPMPALYDRVIPSENTSPLAPREPADAVVINLGTNDFFQGVPRSAAFIDAYLALLDALRARYPKSLLVLGIGPMLADDYPQPKARTLAREWTRTVAERRRTAGDDQVDTIEFWMDPGDGVGCDFHPNVKTHARLGQELAQLLRDRLGW